MSGVSAAELLALPGQDWLHIGGTERKAGWKVLNIQPGEHVDHVGDLRDLSQFADASWDVVYASHVLEHLSYQGEVQAVLAGIRRILRPQGKLMISVPDLGVLCRLYVNPAATALDRLTIMRMMFGGQMDAHDFHYVGFSAELLATFLSDAGFQDLKQVSDFSLFSDTSTLRYGGVPISLNVVAR